MSTCDNTDEKSKPAVENCGACHFWEQGGRANQWQGECKFLRQDEGDGPMSEELKDKLPLAAWTLLISNNQVGCRVGVPRRQDHQ